ncbi:MAG: hypothetical protein H7Z37_13325 [Pyrinomonadaceae bacterium]|nr:hypothetical protein [Pyrinomonadaceae bacterium]
MLHRKRVAEQTRNRKIALYLKIIVAFYDLRVNDDAKPVMFFTDKDITERATL